MNEELRVVISAEVSKLQQGVEKAKKELKSFRQQVEEAKKNVDEDFKKMGESIKTFSTTIVASFAAAGVALLSLAGSTEEYRNQQAQLITAFEAAGSSAAVATETYNGLYRVLGDTGQAQEAAQHLAKLTTEEKALNEWTTICQGVYATFGASLPIESLTEAANETAKTGQLTGALADALNWAGISEDEFQKQLDACNTEAEREALIRNTLNGVYSDAAAKYEVNNAAVLAQRDAQAKLQATLAELGAALAPVITAFTEFATEALAMVAPYIKDLAEKLIPVLKDVLEKVLTTIIDAAKWVKEHETLLQVLAVAIGIITTAITAYNAVAAIKAAMDKAEVATLGELVVAHLAHAAAIGTAIAPYVLVVAAIAAVIAIIVLCVKHWDKIKEAAAKAWEYIKQAWSKAADWFGSVVEGIKQAFANIGEWFSNLFKKAWQGIQAAWSGVKQWFSNLWKEIKNVFSTVVNYYKTVFTNAWNAIKTAWGVVVNWFKGVWDGITNVFSSVGNWFSNIFTQAKNGIQNAFSSITGFFTGIWEKIKNIFSKVGTAIADGIKGAVSSAVNKVLSTATKIINGFISAINFAIDIINAIPGVNIKRLDKLSVPQMAKGGIIDSATLAVVGEQGKEAVMPLENNLEWLDKLAGMLNDRMCGGNQPIVLNVDGKRFAEISVDSINSLTRQRGSIPLVIA